MEIIAGQGLSVFRAALVKPSAVSEAAIRIEDEEIGRAGGSVSPCRILGGVKENWEGKVGFEDHLAEFLRRIIGIGDGVVGADADRRDALGEEFQGQLGHLAAHMDDIRAVGAEENDERSLGAGQFSQGALIPGDDIGQGEVGGGGAGGQEVIEVGGESGHDTHGEQDQNGRQAGATGTILVTGGVGGG